MKTLTCRQLAGACDMEFSADTFDEIGEMSKKHAMEMVEKGDASHKEKMDEMMKMMKEGTAEKWYEDKRKEFESIPDKN